METIINMFCGCLSKRRDETPHPKKTDKETQDELIEAVEAIEEVNYDNVTG